MTGPLRTIVFAGCVAMLTLLPTRAQAQTAGLFDGIWDLDRAASTFGPNGGPRSEIRYYEDRGGGVVLATFEGVDAQGDSTFTQYAAKHDGKPYPMVTSSGTLRQTIAFTKIDAFASDWTVRVDRQVVATGTSSVSLDGGTYTVRSKGVDPGAAETVAVYRRRFGPEH